MTPMVLAAGRGPRDAATQRGGATSGGHWAGRPARPHIIELQHIPHGEIISGGFQCATNAPEWEHSTSRVGTFLADDQGDTSHLKAAVYICSHGMRMFIARSGEAGRGDPMGTANLFTCPVHVAALPGNNNYTRSFCLQLQFPETTIHSLQTTLTRAGAMLLNKFLSRPDMHCINCTKCY